MSTFNVRPDDVSTHGARLAGIAGEVLQAHGTLLATTGAATGTAADGAFEDLLSHWASVAPQFALSGTALSTALRGAGVQYTTTEQAVVTASAQV